MLIFDELKKNDPQLRFVAVALAAGFFILLGGLWWVQVVSAAAYKSHLETQSYRTVRIPAMRGKILDCKGRVLAQNSPRYNLSLYFGDLSSQFQAEYERLRPPRTSKNSRPFWKFWAKSSPMAKSSLTKEQIAGYKWQARYDVANGLVVKMSQTLGLPLAFDYKSFARAYESSLYVPYPIAQSLDAAEIARFEETYSGGMGLGLDVQTTRLYPLGATASDVLGYVQKDSRSVEGEDAFFNYRLPDYRGVIGIEGGFDSQLHGRAGAEAILVNNLGYREGENIWSDPEPGHNVVLTIDLDIQHAAEESLLQHQGSDARAAIVVMDVRTGDVLAMVSSPAVDPNYFTDNLPPDQMQKEAALLNDPKLRPQINRATDQNYAPGSIFKPIVALAALENGLDPDALVDNPGYVYVGRRRIGDLAPPGEYNLRRAIIYSCNTYFITIGLRAGIENIVHMGEKFHLGEREDLPTGQDSRGDFPSEKRINSDWRNGDSANICIGQGEVAVTPLQMAVAYAAIANGGKVLWPRLVDRVEPQDRENGEEPATYPSGVVRDELGVKPSNLNTLRAAMLAETEDPEGTGHQAVVGPEMRICGKTGTAQVMDENNREIGRNTWFASFAPYEHPRYSVIVMVENGTYGGPTCAPIAHDIYEALLKKDQEQTLAAASTGRRERMN